MASVGSLLVSSSSSSGMGSCAPPPRESDMMDGCKRLGTAERARSIEDPGGEICRVSIFCRRPPRSAVAVVPLCDVMLDATIVDLKPHAGVCDRSLCSFTRLDLPSRHFSISDNSSLDRRSGEGEGGGLFQCQVPTPVVRDFFFTWADDNA